MTERHVLKTFLVAGVATIGSYLTIYWYEKYRSKRIPKKWVQVGFVSKICIYPVKSGHKMEIQKAKFTPLGFEKVPDNNNEPIIRDRCIVLLKDGRVFNQEICRKMVQLKTTLINNKSIAIDAPGMETLKIQLPPEKDAPLYDIKEKEYRCTVVRRSARSLGNEADHWFSKCFLGKDSGIKSGYCDGTPANYLTYFCRHALILFMNLIRYDNLTTVVQHVDLLLLNQASIADIQSRIETYDPENPITEDRFRGNILVAGPGIRPYDEDAWEWLKIGDKMVTRKVEDCIRCVVTTLNPDTGGRNKAFEPIKTLNKYRTTVTKAIGTGPAVGIYMEIIKHEGAIEVGDPIFIASTDDDSL